MLNKISPRLYFSGSICVEALLKDQCKFRDDIFKASAIRSTDYAAKYGRLYSPRPWCLPDNKVNVNQFLEIHLPGIFSLSAVATVGGSLGYVTSYKLLGAVDGSGWRYATVNNQEVIFH